MGFLKGAVGGDSGCEAALLNFLFAVEMAAALEDGESRNMRKPKKSTMARAMLIGLVLRNDLASAILPRVRKEVWRAGQAVQRFL